MASDGQLRDWVSDKLMSLLGYSKSVVVQYVIRLGRRWLAGLAPFPLFLLSRRIRMP